MPVLDNPRHERFAQLVSSGTGQTEAYIAVGYSKSGANQSARRLRIHANVAARIKELLTQAAESTVAKAVITRDWVINGLKCVAEDPEETGSARVAAYKLCGQEIGMFIDRTDHTIQWNGDLSQLNAAQLQKMMAILEQIAFNGNPELIAAAKAEAIETLQ